MGRSQPHVSLRPFHWCFSAAGKRAARRRAHGGRDPRRGNRGRHRFGRGGGGACDLAAGAWRPDGDGLSVGGRVRDQRGGGGACAAGVRYRSAVEGVNARVAPSGPFLPLSAACLAPNRSNG